MFKSIRHTKVQKSCVMDFVQNRCESSLRHGETVDILTIAQFVAGQKRWRAYDPLYEVKILGRFLCKIFLRFRNGPFLPLLFVAPMD